MKTSSKKTNLNASTKNRGKKTVGSSTKKTAPKPTVKKTTTKATSSKTVPKVAPKKTTSKPTTKKAVPAKTSEPKPSTAKPKKTERYMLRKAGLDKQGNQQFTAVRVYQRMPNGWKETEGALTAPVGYKWIDNGKSLFKGRKSALLEVKDRK